MLDKDC